jgi:sugar-phosphatase
MLVSPGHGRVHAHLPGDQPLGVDLRLQGGEDLLPGAVALPAPKQPIHRLPGTVAGGRSRQGAPVRVRQPIPSISWRLLQVGGRPDFLPWATAAPAWPTVGWSDLLVPWREHLTRPSHLLKHTLADLDDVIALPGTQTLLRDLPADRWAAVTSGSRALMLARLAAAGLPVPEVLVSADDVSVGKPHPEGYRKAAAALGYDIARCLVVEDAPAGIQAGQAAGAHTLAVATSHSALELSSADAVVPDLTACTVERTADALLLATTA